MSTIGQSFHKNGEGEEISHTSFNVWQFSKDDLPPSKKCFLAVFHEIEPIFIKFSLDFH